MPSGSASQRDPGAALGVGEDLLHPGAQQLEPVALGELGQPQLADPVGGRLGAQVGEALARRAHLRGEPLQLALADPGRRDHDPLFLERSSSEPASRLGSGPPMSAWWARQAAKPSSSPRDEDRRDQRHVGQVGAAPVGVVEDPGDARALLLVQHRGDRVGHRAEVDGDVLGLHHELAAASKSAVEQSWRSLMLAE